MKISKKRYFLPYGLNEVFIKIEESDDNPKIENLCIVTKNEEIKQSAFCYFFLNWGGVFILVLGIIAGTIRYLDLETNQEAMDPDAMPDYALASAGAEIVGTPVANSYKWKNKLVSLPDWILPSDGNPESVLQPWKSPGECWAFEGTVATIRIRLSHLIVPKFVTIEHIPASISPTGNIKSAPKDFSVYGVDDNLLEFMGNFKYTGTEKLETFTLQPETNLAYPYRTLQFEFYTNHGHTLYTCVYKIRVHGKNFKYKD